MNTEQLRHYQTLRRRYPTMPAQTALARARGEHQQEPIPWEETCQTNVYTALLTRDGFQVLVQKEPDEDYDSTRYRGEFTDCWERGAIDNPRAQTERCVYRYFIPERSEEERVQEYRGAGYGRTEAHEMARADLLEDMKIAADPESMGYSAYWISVKVVHPQASAVILGRDSVGDVEVCGDQESDTFLNAVAWECLHNAIEDAKKNLAKLTTR